MIHKTTADSKGSCSKYVHYLEKENEQFIKENHPERQQYFFNHDANKIDTIKAIYHIDENTKGKGLKTKEDKYFTLTINYSPKELKHLISKVTDQKITHVDQLSQKEYYQYNDLIKEHVKASMKNYAENFGNGITQKDIKWVAKVEHYRTYKGFEKQVKKGSFKSGDRKPGLHTHCHIVVHRSHATKRIRLSPHRKAKNTTKHQLRGKKVANSNFHKVEFIKKNEHSFDQMFQYNRSLEEKFTVQNVLKNGQTIEKKTVMIKIGDQKIKQYFKLNKDQQLFNRQQKEVIAKNKAYWEEKIALLKSKDVSIETKKAIIEEIKEDQLLSELSETSALELMELQNNMAIEDIELQQNQSNNFEM